MHYFLEVFSALLFLSYVPSCLGVLSGWSSSPTQYHVQNDEGPDRFFRYQTYNGQYRKERRMDDGTVVGSYGWVDPAGYLRMTDYIADGKGYRVVKSRMEFVGVKPETSGLEEKPGRNHTPTSQSQSRVVRQRLPEPTTSEPPTSRVVRQRLPEPTTSEPPTTSTSTSSPTGPKFPSPHVDPPPPKQRPMKRRRVKVLRRASTRHSTPATRDPPKVDPIERRPFIIQITRGEKSGKPDVFKGYATPLRSGNGFLYKIPNQYHKEETDREGSRAGSFGYIDPFGIRRVIHYNTNQEGGFDAQTDFKYVGDHRTE